MKRLTGLILILSMLFFSAVSGAPAEITPEDSSGLSAQANSLLSVTVVPAGPYVWYFAGDVLTCADAALRQDAARIPLAALYAEEPGCTALQRAGISLDGDASVAWLSLVPRDETGVSLCLALADPDGAVHALMYDLARSEGSQIVISGVRDMTEPLGIFFDPDRGWMEIAISRLEDGTFLIGALDPEYQYHLYTCGSADAPPAEIASESLMKYDAAVPCGSGLLLVCYSLENMSTLELSALDPVSGERGEPEALSAGTDVTGAFCFVWDKAENLQELYEVL